MLTLMAKGEDRTYIYMRLYANEQLEDTDCHAEVGC